MNKFNLTKGMRLRNKITKSRWEVCDVLNDKLSVQIVCIYSSIADEVGTDRTFSLLALSDKRMWEIEDDVVPVGKETPEISRHIQKLCSPHQDGNVLKLMSDEEADKLRKKLTSGDFVIPSTKNWLFDVVILEFVEGNRVRAHLIESNDKYLKYSFDNDYCHLTCMKMIGNREEYIRLITAPDEYWEEYIDSFMMKHFKVVED